MCLSCIQHTMSLRRRSRVTEQDLKDVLEMKRERDMLQQRRQNIEQNIEKERELAKKSIQDGMKEKALQHTKEMQDQRQRLTRLEERLAKLEDKILEIDLYKIEAEAEDIVKKVKENRQKWNDSNEEENVWQAVVKITNKGWSCFFIEMMFEAPKGQYVAFTTEVNIVPDTFPSEHCEDWECKGTLV
ncbi:Charged multivesicular body protein 6 [Holothuria leucospilota]|uniref:Charged multivesicular body protein 6 n=1 Tax=Holothuria leucospilota TaxID=206669 RepID=A0A9Q1C286_HOLLE|nr:Charged multivesicular body protein 6 [Holothuria leucospilota]